MIKFRQQQLMIKFASMLMVLFGLSSLENLPMLDGGGVVGWLGLMVGGLRLLTNLLGHLGWCLDWDMLAVLLGHLVTALLGNLVALLLWHLAAVLFRVLLANLLGHLDVLIVTHFLGNILALLFGLRYGLIVA